MEDNGERTLEAEGDESPVFSEALPEAHGIGHADRRFAQVQLGQVARTIP